METLTATKEINEKTMVMKVDVLNKWIHDAGFPEMVRAFKKDAIEDKNYIFRSSLGYKNHPKVKGKDFDQIVSETLRISVIKIHWNNDDDVKIHYLDL